MKRERDATTASPWALFVLSRFLFYFFSREKDDHVHELAKGARKGAYNREWKEGRGGERGEGASTHRIALRDYR